MRVEVGKRKPSEMEMEQTETLESAGKKEMDSHDLDHEMC